MNAKTPHGCKVKRSIPSAQYARAMATGADPFSLPTERQANYQSAGRGRLLRMWRPPSSGPNYSIAHDVPVLRSRARDAARNDPWEGAALDKLDANGIATGIQAKMINGTDAQKRAVKLLWNAFMEECDADGVLDGYGLQALAWREWNEAGEVFGRLRYRNLSDGLQVPLQVQVIESELCPSDLYTRASNGNVVKAGIEFNAIGKRVAYWMYREHPGDEQFSFRGRDLVRVPADQIIHLYRPLRAGQIRGIPEQAATLVRMFKRENMENAVLDRQQLANLFTGFLTKNVNPEELPENVVDDLSTDDSGHQETDADDTPLIGLEPGTMVELPTGYKPEFSQPPAPNLDYQAYLRQQLLAHAARRGVPYEVLTGDLTNVSDRALRLILNEFRRLLEMRQWLFFIPQWCARIRREFFDVSHLARKLPEIGDYAERPLFYQETLYVPEGWPYSHPVQDVVADIKAIRAGLDSRQATQLRAGNDPEEIDRQQAEDNARADAAGLVYDSDGRRTSAAGLTQARPAGTTFPSTTDDDDDANQPPDEDRTDENRQ